ncbi:hypothetical protein ACE193_16970 [Bernardetia sp. OM2101]|uniref:hypothetical protein n=1 Tax=Bernardetia sp. OM2101 TaxID=3344876 RepID=UPI0035CFA452
MTFLFWFLFFTISFLSVLTSLLSKNGESIQVFLFPILCGVLYFVIQSNYVKNGFLLFQKNNLKKFLLLILGSILIWLLNAVFVFNIFELTSTFPFRIPSKDSVFYARLSERLLTSEYESFFAFHNDTPAVLGTSPYHFFELWLTAFFSKLFAISGYLAYSLITLPLLQICVWVGFLSIYERFNLEKNTSQPSFSAFAWCVALLFLGGIYFPFYQYSSLFSATYWLSNTIFTGLSEHYFFWVAAFIFYSYKNYRAIIWVVFTLVFVSPTLWASCWAGLFVVGVVLFYQKKIEFLKKYKLESVLFFLLPLCYLGFYHFTKSEQNVADESISVLLLSQSSSTFFRFFKQVTLYAFNFVLIFIPFVFIFYNEFLQVTKKIIKPIKNNKITFQPIQIIFLFFVGATLGAIFFYLLLPFHIEKFQFLRNFILPFVQVGLIYFFIKLKNNLNNKVKVLFSFLLLYQFVFTLHWFWRETYLQQEHSQEYLNEIGKQENLEIGAVWYEKEDYEARLVFNRIESFEIEGEYLAFKTGIKRIYNLNMACVETEKEPSFMTIEADVFAIWLRENNPKKEIVCTDSLKTIFIKEYNLDFLILGQNVSIPTQLQSKIKFQIQDKKSGEVFLRLK